MNSYILYFDIPSIPFSFYFSIFSRKFRYIGTVFIDLDIEKYRVLSYSSLSTVTVFFFPFYLAQMFYCTGDTPAVYIEESRFEIYRAHGAGLFICSPMVSIFGNGLKSRVAR
jgi:hypothetical protein